MPGGIIKANAWDDFDPLDVSKWEEYVGDDGKREDTVTNGESLSTIRGYVLSDELVLPALTYWLGYSWVDWAGGVPIVRRRLPAAHPQTPQLFAKRVQVRGWKYDGNVRHVAIGGRRKVGGVRVPYAKYEKYFFEIDFEMAPYKVLPDNHIKPDGTPITEWDRFTTVEPEDNTEIIIVDGGIYRYKTGTLAGKPITIHGPKLQRIVERTRLTTTVHNLPYDLIFDEYDIPRKLMKAKGKVNDRAFRGFNGQTIMLEGYKPKKYPQTVATQTWTVLQFGVDMEFKFNYQEPEKADPAETLAGWNLVPEANTRWDAGWIGVETTTSQAMYQKLDLNNLITHWSLDDL